MGFYGDNINLIDSEVLLSATPCSEQSDINFKPSLTEDELFNELYTEVSQDVGKSSENSWFLARINAAMAQVDNPFGKVHLINVMGYGGCGKTTFVRHLLWERFRDSENRHVIDFEGYTEIEKAYIDQICRRVLRDLSENARLKPRLEEFLAFPLRAFKHEEAVKAKLRELYALDNAPGIENALRSWDVRLKTSREEALYCLILIDFLLELWKCVLAPTEPPLVVLLDNVDAISNTEYEIRFVTALKTFISDCGYFFSTAYEKPTDERDARIRSVLRNVSYVCFLTTRVVTANKYLGSVPKLEDTHGWVSVSIPENLYHHVDIIAKRVDYYMREEHGRSAEKLAELSMIRQFASSIYRQNPIYKRLLNGSYRQSVKSLNNILRLYGDTGLVSELIALANSESQDQDIYEGISGFAINLLLNYFKENGIYEEKLHLVPQESGCIPIAAAILTVVWEKGGTCSFFDVLALLSPMYPVSELCTATFDLCNANQDIWRRLITFRKKFPESVQDLHAQGKRFEKDNTGELDFLCADDEDYSTIVICKAGVTYMRSIVPHFEFMLSQHNMSAKLSQLRRKGRYYPLFSASSMKPVSSSDGEMHYLFESKIDWVYQDVEASCRQSLAFAKKAMDKFNYDRLSYVESSFYTFQPQNPDGTLWRKQSYETRLIFSHIGYIDRYRRYLLEKYRANGEMCWALNRKLVERIERYVTLYQNPEMCLQTQHQDTAAQSLQKQIEKIKLMEYKDYVTPIEIM